MLRLTAVRQLFNFLLVLHSFRGCGGHVFTFAISKEDIILGSIYKDKTIHYSTILKGFPLNIFSAFYIHINVFIASLLLLLMYPKRFYS